MIKSLALKELRDVLGIAGIALALYLALVSSLIGLRLFSWIAVLPQGTNQVPFAGNAFSGSFTLIAVVFAIALGLRQSAWESLRGTYLFLLHRPVARELIFATKIATGISVLVVLSVAPIVVYGTWAATPGTHPSPFNWSMTLPMWRLCALLPVLYLGAFLTGLRVARWVGTRLLPLAAAGFVVAALTVPPWVWWLGWPAIAIGYAALVMGILYVAHEREYS